MLPNLSHLGEQDRCLKHLGALGASYISSLA